MMVVHYVFADRLKSIGTERALSVRSQLMYELEQFALIYGDDLCWTFSDDLIRDLEELVCEDGYLEEVVNILKDQFDMVLKPPGSSDTNAYPTPYANITSDGVVIPGRDNDYGFKWLRRYFYKTNIHLKDRGDPENGVPDKEYDVANITSVRRISDYWSKATNTHHDARTYPNKKWLERIKAFTVENAGGSVAIDRFCRIFYHSLEGNPVNPVGNLLELEGSLPVKGRVSSSDFDEVKDGQGKEIPERKKYLLLDPEISDEFIKAPCLPSRSYLVRNFGMYTSSARFEMTLRRCRNALEGPRGAPREFV